MIDVISSLLSSRLCRRSTQTPLSLKPTKMEKEDENKDAISDGEESLIIDSDDDESIHDQESGNQSFKSTNMTNSWEMQVKESALSEFISLEDDLGINMENRNTQRKTDTDIRILIAYLRSLNETRSPESISPMDLDRYLSNFFTIVKKHDGNEYEPASLRGMLCSVERYLKMKNYEASVTRDIVFVNTRHALKYKQQRLRDIGKGSKKPSEPFGKVTLDKVNQLFSAHEMGPYTPMSIINTLCFMFIVHFRLRKAIDHKNLSWGDVQLRSDQSGKEYLLFDSSATTSDLNTKPDVQNHSNLSKLCIWAQPDIPERDPVGIYRIYRDKRPSNMKHDNSPFYLGITTLHPSPMQAWYRTCAMGVNKLSDLVRMIRNITGLPRASLNAPAESLLSESYAAGKSAANIVSRMLPMQYQVPSSYVYPSTGPVIHPLKPLSIPLPKSPSSTWSTETTINPISSEQLAQEESESKSTPNQCTEKITDTSKHLVNEIPAKQDCPKRGYFGQRSRASSCSSNSNSIISNITLDKKDPTNLTASEVKKKIVKIIRKLNADSTEELQAWLRTVRVIRNQQTGEVECQHTSADETASERFESASMRDGDSETQITLNITLSPSAIKGQGPVTVTATTHPSPKLKSSERIKYHSEPQENATPCNDMHHDDNLCTNEGQEVMNENSKRHQNQIGISNTKVGKNPEDCQTRFQSKAEERIPRKRNVSSSNDIHDHSTDKVPKSLDATSAVGLNLSNKYTLGDFITTPSVSVSPMDSNSITASCSLNNPLCSSSATPSKPHLLGNVPSSHPPSVNDHVVGDTVGYSAGTTVIPRAHTSMPQRFSSPDGRDLGFILPVPLPYAGQPSLTNRMVQNSAMLASLTAPPMSAAHAAGLLHQSLLHSINVSNNLTDISSNPMNNSNNFLRGHVTSDGSNQQSNTPD